MVKNDANEMGESARRELNPQPPTWRAGVLPLNYEHGMTGCRVLRELESPNRELNPDRLFTKQELFQFELFGRWNVGSKIPWVRGGDEYLSG